ncbi:MAG: GntR family transcriptional regulator [Streptosporangiaceae bacterium]
MADVSVRHFDSAVKDRPIDLRSSIPAYRQLAEIVRQDIESGELARDQMLPSETTLIQRYGIARGTVRRAIEVLREAGLVVTVQGRGTYVR